MTMLLLKTTSHKTSFVTLKRTIRASLNFIDPLTSDGHEEEEELDPMCQCAEAQKSPLPSQAAIPDEQHLDKKLVQRQRKDHSEWENSGHVVGNGEHEGHKSDGTRKTSYQNYMAH
jgi:hypothetical protein